MFGPFALGPYVRHFVERRRPFIAFQNPPSPFRIDELHIRIGFNRVNRRLPVASAARTSNQLEPCCLRPKRLIAVNPESPKQIPSESQLGPIAERRARAPVSSEQSALRIRAFRWEDAEEFAHRSSVSITRIADRCHWVSGLPSAFGIDPLIDLVPPAGPLRGPVVVYVGKDIAYDVEIDYDGHRGVAPSGNGLHFIRQLNPVQRSASWIATEMHERPVRARAPHATSPVVKVYALHTGKGLSDRGPLRPT